MRASACDGESAAVLLCGIYKKLVLLVTHTITLHNTFSFADVLLVARGGAKKTAIAHNANLNFDISTTDIEF